MTSLKADLTKGVFYIAVAKYSGMAVQLIITAILARLLCPEDYGAIAVASVFINFFYILGDIGVGPAIIQNQSLTKKDIDNIFSFTVYMGIILSSVFFLSSHAIASYYESDVLNSVCKILSVMIMAYCLTIVPQNLMYKDKEFKKISFATLVINITAGFCSVIAAFAGWGVYALVLSQVLSSVLTALYFYSKRPQHFIFRPMKTSLQKIMLFSVFQFLFNVVNYFGRNVDKMLVGRYLGMQDLGYYEKSYRLMLLPLQNITFVISPVLLPNFASYQNDPRGLGEKYYKMVGLLSYIAIPLTVILYFCSAELILCFFGDQWGSAVVTFKILTLTVGMQILTSTTGAIFQSVNKTKSMFIAGLCGAIFMIASFLITLNVWCTIEAVAAGYLVAQILNTIQCFYLINKCLSQSASLLLVKISKPSICGVILLMAYLLIPFTLISENIFVLLLLKGAYGVGISLILVQIFGKIDIIGLIKKRINNNHAAIR